MGTGEQRRWTEQNRMKCSKMRQPNLVGDGGCFLFRFIWPTFMETQRSQGKLWRKTCWPHSQASWELGQSQCSCNFGGSGHDNFWKLNEISRSTGESCLTLMVDMWLIYNDISISIYLSIYLSIYIYIYLCVHIWSIYGESACFPLTIKGWTFTRRPTLGSSDISPYLCRRCYWQH